MFGHRFFGAVFYGPRYFGAGSIAAVVAQRHGGGYGGTQNKRGDYQPHRQYENERRRRIAARHDRAQRADLAIPAEIDKRVEAEGRQVTAPPVVEVASPQVGAPGPAERASLAPFAELLAGPPLPRHIAAVSRGEAETIRRQKIAAAEARVAARASAREDDDIEIILLLAA